MRHASFEDVTPPGWSSRRRRMTCAALAALLALLGCSDGDEAAGPEGPAIPTPESPVPLTVQSVTVVVTDQRLQPLSGAKVTLSNQLFILTTATTAADGTVRLETTERRVRIHVLHDLGYRSYDLAFLPGNSARLEAVLAPASTFTAGILPARIVDGSLSADRTELAVALRIFRGAGHAFERSSYGSFGSTPLMRVQNCWIWLEPGETLSCRYEVASKAAPVSITWDREGSPAWSAAPVFPSALLLLEQSHRAVEYDPNALRWNAAHGFVLRIGDPTHAGTPARVAVAGFSATSAGTGAALLLAPPAWQDVDPGSAWNAGEALQLASLQALESPGTGEPVVLQGLRAATSLMAEHAPAGDRSIIALLGGGEPSASAGPTSALALLRQQQQSASIRTLLVAGRLPEESAERERLAQLAAQMDAPLIFAGYPAEWRERFDGLHDALALASDIVRGVNLPSLHLVVRLRTDVDSPFVSGSMLTGTVYVESDFCPMGCAEYPLAFAAVVP